MVQYFSERCGSTFPLVFRRANELQSEPHLFFCDERLDRLIGGLRVGQVIFLYGSKQCLALSEFLCIRSQIEFDGNVIFIDGGNSFDPYLLAQYAEENLLDRDKVLDRTLVSRAFTCYQLTSLITQTLPRTVHERKIRLVIVSDVIDLYCDPDLCNERSLDLLKISFNTLVTLARAERDIVLTTSLEGAISSQFLCAVKQRADVVLRFEERCSFTRLILEKHPVHSEESLIIKQSTPRVLEEFLEAIGDGQNYSFMANSA